MKNTLGFRLRQARENKGYSQRQIEQATKISNANLSRYELDQTSPGIDTLRTLANFYDVSLDWIFGVTNSPNRVTSDDLKPYDVKWVALVNKCKKSGLTPDQVEQIIDVLNNVK